MFKLKNRINDSFFDDIYGKKLDKYQRKAIINNDKYLLVVAGAGSGKTLTIIGKVKYLIEKLHFKEEEILCLSFTNETVDNLKNKLNYSVDVFTFHKLSLNILKDHNFNYKIARDDLLEYIVNEFFLIDDLDNKSLILEYFDNDYSYNSLELLKMNIISMIKMIKCNNLHVEKLKKIKRKIVFGKDKIFYLLVLKIFKIYEEELLSENKIDFDDMIIYAKESIKEKGINKKYKYIIIDEYQDISQIRFNLIKEMIDKLDCKLMCVGDDYQAIYGFSRSNVSLFLDFFKYFKDGTRLDIKNTYRNSYELIKISLRFIKRNPFQLRKNIHATFLYKNPVVLVYYDDFLKVYNDLLNYLYLEDNKKVLVLARYNKDLEEIKKFSHQGMDIRYLTVHMAKGLEEDNVILIRFSNDYLGFPSKIENNRLLSLVSTNEEVPFAEERRLFYVALTRCRRRIFILVPRNNPSIFLKEIKSSCVELLLKGK